MLSDKLLPGVILTLLLWAPAGLVLIAASQPREPLALTTYPARGGTLRVGLNSDLTTMDPHNSTAAVDRQVYQSIYNPLVRLDKDLTIKPALAEQWEYSDPVTLVLILRKGVKFHDGTDFNAKAVKVNFDRMLDPEIQSFRTSEIASIKEVRVVDDHTVELLLKKPDAALLAHLTDRAGMIISPAALEKFGKDLARNPVGTGPFQFVKWAKDDYLMVKKFDSYWQNGADGKPLPYLDQVIYKPVTDAIVRLTSLKTGTLDMIDSVAPQDAAGLRRQRELVFDEVPGLGYMGLSLNHKKPPFDKLEVRQAVAYALDRDVVAKTILAGTAIPGQGPIAPSSWAYDPSVAPFTHDPQKAKELLQKAGVVLPVKFGCYVTNTPESIQVAQAWQQQLAEAGMEMQIELLEFGTALAKFNNLEHTCFQVSWSGRPDPDGNTFAFLHSQGGLNRNQYINHKVDELLEQARMIYEQARRKELYTEAVQIASREVAIVYLYWALAMKAWTPNLKGYVHVPDGMMRFTDVWLSK
jgi:peptide/nickel transport system substrate-binding protein